MWNSFSTNARLGLTAEVITHPGGGADGIHAWFGLGGQRAHTRLR